MVGLRRGRSMSAASNASAEEQAASGVSKNKKAPKKTTARKTRGSSVSSDVPEKEPEKSVASTRNRSGSDASNMSDPSDSTGNAVTLRRGRSASNVSNRSDCSDGPPMVVSDTRPASKKAKKSPSTASALAPVPATSSASDDSMITATNEETTPTVLAAYEPAAATANIQPGRSSSLHSPTMQLTGHTGPVYSCAFDKHGKVLASAGMDRGIFLWDVESAAESNFNVLRGHKNGILQLQWLATGEQIVSCSADKTIRLWDASKGTRLRKMEEHTGIINSVAVAGDQASDMVLSGSDDCTAVLWDLRQPKPSASLYQDYQLTAVALSADGLTAYTGGIDNIIRIWDLRRGEPEEPQLELSGHTDTITGLALSPDGTTLLSNAMDGALRTWNVRPFVANVPEASGNEQGVYRQERLFLGHRHGAEKALLRCSWSPDGLFVTAGSSDLHVHIWDAQSCEPIYRLPGHSGSVNCVEFHPSQPVIASCSTDRSVWLGELA